MELLGRRTEREVVGQLLVGARAGRSGVLVVRGEAGIGESAVLDLVRDAAVSSGFRVEQSAGAESETQFAFSGLHRLYAPLLDHAGALPEPQQAVLGVAFGLRGGAAPDRFLVGLAALTVLAEVAEEGPLLCLVDDAQWLDEASAQVLALVARRVAAERVALVFGLRDPGEGDVRPFDGLPELRSGGLAETDARTLLATRVPAVLDEEVRERVLAEARGNPLALLEPPHGPRPARLAGGFGVPDVVGVPRRIEEFYARRSGSLPADTQLLLLVAAAEPTGEVTLPDRPPGHRGRLTGSHAAVDCSSTHELLSYEALGLTPEGTGERFVADGDDTYGAGSSPTPQEASSPRGIGTRWESTSSSCAADRGAGVGQ